MLRTPRALVNSLCDNSRNRGAITIGGPSRGSLTRTAQARLLRHGNARLPILSNPAPCSLHGWRRGYPPASAAPSETPTADGWI